MSKTVLLTGGAGFVGHHVIEYFLKNTDYNIVSLDRLDYSGNYSRIAEVVTEETQHRVRIVWHDLKAPINSQIAKKIGAVDIILHLAAGSHVDRSIDCPMEFVLDNIVGTCNLLDFARTQKLEKFVYFSTDEVFGPAPDGVFYKENDRYNSGNPYAATKAGAEELSLAFGNTYKLPVIVTHTMNVFGERQHPEKFIPKVIRSVSLGQSVTIHANATKTKAGSRHYIHCDDVASALLFVLNHGVIGEKYNIVGSEELDNLTLSKIIADVVGKPLMYEMVDFHSSRPGHDLRYALCGEKMKSMGWTPAKTVRERLQQVVTWTLENDRWLCE